MVASQPMGEGTTQERSSNLIESRQMALALRCLKALHSWLSPLANTLY